MHKTIINTNVSHIHTESLRDHEWGWRAPPQNGGKARNKWGFGRFYRKVSIWFWLVLFGINWGYVSPLFPQVFPHIFSNLKRKDND